MAGSVVFFVAMNNIVKYLSLPSEEKVFWRMIAGVITVLVAVRLRFAKREFNNLTLLIMRGVFGAAAVMTYFYAIDNTTLGRATFFQFTYPAWSSLFSALFLKERLGWRRAAVLAVMFAGAALILVSPKAGGQSHVAGDFAGILCGLCSGAAVTTIRGLHRTDTTWMIFLFFSMFSSAAGIATSGIRHNYVSPTSFQWLVVLAMAVTGTLAQLTFTASYRYLDVTAAGAMAMMQAPLSALTAYFFFNESLSSRAMFGAALVLGGGIFLASTSKGEMLRPSE